MQASSLQWQQQVTKPTNEDRYLVTNFQKNRGEVGTEFVLSRTKEGKIDR